MRRNMLLLLCFLAISSLLYSQFDFFPRTNVMEVKQGPTDLVEAAIAALQETYIEDELIILKHPSAIPGFVLGFNGRMLINDPPIMPLTADGQPIKGEMSAVRFTPAYLYINQPTFDGTNITFTLMSAPDFIFETPLTIIYLIVDKATNVIDYIGNQANVTQPIEYSHTATQTFSTNTHKAVILILGEGEEILQAASTTRVLPPFRMATFSSLCEVIPNDVPLYDFQHFYLVNMDTQTQEAVTVHFEMTALYNEPEFVFNFCDVASGNCFDAIADLSIVAGSSINEYKPTVFRTAGQEGSLILRCALSAGDYAVDFRLYVVMPTLDILILQDHAGENRDDSVIGTHSGTSFSFGLWEVGRGEVTDELLSHFDYVIWNQSGVYPNLKHRELEVLQRYVTQNNGALLAIGQNLANSLGDVFYSSYANNSTIAFLQNVLIADIARPASVSNTLHSTDAGVFQQPVTFDLINEGATAHHSTTALQARNGSIPLFVDGNQNTKAVITPTLNNAHITGLFDFDFDSIPAGSRLDVMRETTIWLPTDPENEGLEKPKALSVATYPNPFNPSLNISVEVLNSNDPVNIAVYNVKGQKVKNLHNGLPTANRFSVVWNGNDENGVSMASGVYFIRVNNQTQQDMKRVILLK